MTRTLVLGGARSGKSMYAQRAAEAAAAGGGQLVMIVTAEAGDDEMRGRIAHHRAARGPAWRTRETPLALTDALNELGETDIAVIDCLTLWVSNLMMKDADLDAETQNLTQAIRTHRGRLIIVSNEVGFGIVPENALARRFRDACGRLHQNLGAAADEVILVVAGQPLKIK
ncbi:MAG: bifunctional adenosylcobinamide kinase/adenosylcobinamide-phosphate guanylyltransferase [Rhodospirillaceae bacterium]|nr:bifunctional adenosylcobinamide kinase/adenosylcobinamide-phosphate guanylyltransferase [Rhodospirillaceae bacterium]